MKSRSLWMFLLVHAVVASSNVQGFMQVHQTITAREKLGRHGRSKHKHMVAFRKHLGTLPLSTKSRPCSSSTLLRDTANLRGGRASPPKLSRWIFPALSSALSYALYNICIKLGATAGIHPMLGGVVLQIVATVLGSTMLVLVGRKDGISYTTKGLLWSVGAGLAVGAAEILSFYISGMGVQASQSIPVMVGGSVAMGSLLGVLLLREQLSFQGWLGVIFVVAGVVCVATDPKSTMGH